MTYEARYFRTKPVPYIITLANYHIVKSFN